VNKTVSYKRAREIKSQDMIIFPDNSVRKVAGRFIEGKKVYVTFVGGAQRCFDANDMMKLSGFSPTNKVPGYFKSHFEK